MEILKHLNDEKPVNLQHSRFEKALQPSEAKIKEMKPRKGGPQNFQNFGKLLQVQQVHKTMSTSLIAIEYIGDLNQYYFMAISTLWHFPSHEVVFSVVLIFERCR